MQLDAPTRVPQPNPQARALHRGHRGRTPTLGEEARVITHIRNLKTIGERELQGFVRCADRLRGSRCGGKFHVAHDAGQGRKRSGNNITASVARGERVRAAAERTERDRSSAPFRSSGPSRRTSLIAATSPRCWFIAAPAGKASASQLLAAAERAALEAGRTLLVLDTASGDAERLYVRQGWQRSGEIPNYALHARRRPFRHHHLLQIPQRLKRRVASQALPLGKPCSDRPGTASSCCPPCNSPMKERATHLRACYCKRQARSPAKHRRSALSGELTKGFPIGLPTP